jgi:chromosome segregation and condensation protein ScpB
MDNQNNESNEPQILTLRDVARILRCRTGQIYELTRRRLQERSSRPLPVFTIHSKMKRVRKKDLMDWLDELVGEQRQQPGKKAR